MLRDVIPAQIVYGTDLKMVSETVNNRLAGEKVKSNYQFRGVKKDGSIIHVEVFGTVTQQAGKPVTIGTLMDVTEKVNAENEIRKSNERFELIGRATNEAIWEWNLETNKVWGNEIHQNLYGLTIKDPVPGYDEWIRRLHPDDKERILETHAKAIASTQKSYTVEYCLFTENKGWMNIFGRTYIERNESGIPVRLLGTMMDVTDRINADEKIKESEEIRRLIMDSSMDAIICVDIKGAITVWTPQAEKVFGWTKEEVLGKTLTETIIPFQYRERHKEGFSKHLLTGEGPMLRKTFEISALRQNAGEFPVELTIMPIKNGDTEFFCAFIRDITDRKKNEKAIIESEEKYRSLIEQASEPIMIYSFDGSIHEFNKAAVEILGYSHEEFAN